MATAEANLKDFITCAVCLEEFKGRDPRSLPCLHAFCLSCIQHIHQTATDSKTNELRHDEFRCPTCQKISPIPNNSILDFQHFYHANALHDIYQDINKSTTASKKQWSLCWNDHRDVERYCFTCTKSFCHQCFLPHTKTRRYADHVHVQVTKDNIQCLVCTEHDQFVEAYCTDCGRSVCDQCQLISHRCHDIQDFVIEELSVEDPLIAIQERITKNAQNYKMIENIHKAFIANIDSIRNKVSEHTNSLIDSIVEQCNSLHTQLEKLKRDKNREMENVREQSRKSENMMNKIEQKIKETTWPIPQLPTIRPKHADKIITEIKNQLPNIAYVNEDMKTYQFIPKATHVALGNLSELNRSPNTCIPVVAERPRRLVTQIAVGSEIRDIAWTKSADLMVVLHRGDILVFDRHGNTKKSLLNLSDVGGRIYSIAHHPTKSVVAVLSGEGANTNLYLMSLETRQSELVGSLPYRYDRVTFTSNGDLLLSSEIRVLKCKTDGITLWTRRTQHEAWYMTVLPSNKCLISGGGKMSMYDKDGKWKSVSKLQQLSDPSGVCADSKGHVYIADYENKVVLMFTSDWKYIRHLLKCDESPVHLALFQDRYLCVAESSGCPKLSIHSLE